MNEMNDKTEQRYRELARRVCAGDADAALTFARALGTFGRLTGPNRFLVEHHATQGHPPSMAAIGEAMLESKNTTEQAEGWQWLEKAGHLDEPNALYLMAQKKMAESKTIGAKAGKIACYEHAAGFYARAAQQQHAGALFHLGVLYAEGKGVQLNIGHALQLIDMAKTVAGARGSDVNLDEMSRVEKRIRTSSKGREAAGQALSAVFGQDGAAHLLLAPATTGSVGPKPAATPVQPV